MTSPSGSARCHGRCRHVGAVAILIALLAGLLSVATPAAAYWSASGAASAGALTGTVAAPIEVTAANSATAEVSVSWEPGVGGVAPLGYYVTRIAGETSVAGCVSGPSALLADTSCTDMGVPAGEYSYVVTAVYRSWTAASAPSAVVTVTSPTVLEAAERYSVLAATAVTNTGDTTVAGDLGVSPGTTLVGISPGMIGGQVHAGDADAAAAHSAVVHAYADLSTRTADVSGLLTNLGGLTLGPGVYHSTAALALTGNLILDGQSDLDALFIFQTDAAFNTAAASSVTLTNGAQPANIYWVVEGAAGTGANSFLFGTIVAKGAITLGASTELIGRALSLDAVTMAANTIRFTVALPATISIDGGTSAITKDTSPTITGTSTAAVSSTVTVTIGGQTHTTTISPTGTWAVTATALTASAYPLVARVREANGNGNTTSQTLTVEVNPSPVDTGSAGTFSVLAATAVVNTGDTTMTGDLGVSPGTSVTGFGPGIVEGQIHAGDATAATAQTDFLTAFTDASTRTAHTQITGNLGTRTFHIGVHHSIAALALTGTVTLDAEDNPDAIFIFQTDAAFNTAAASTVNLVNGAKASNVYWVVTGAAGTGANSHLEGSILAGGAITLGADSSLTGQALSRDTVTLAANTLTGVTPAPAARRAIDPIPTPTDQLSQPAAATASTASSAPAAEPSTDPDQDPSIAPSPTATPAPEPGPTP